MWPFSTPKPEIKVEKIKEINNPHHKYADNTWVQFRTPDGINEGRIECNTRSCYGEIMENYDKSYPDYPIWVNDGQNNTINVKEENILKEILEPPIIKIDGIYIIIDKDHELSVGYAYNNPRPKMTILQSMEGMNFLSGGPCKAIDIKFDSYCAAFDYLFENERKISKCDPTLRLSRSSIVEKIRRAQLKEQE